MSSIDQPIIFDLHRSRLDIGLELGALALLALIWGVTIYHYAELPDEVPRHFDASGEPDAWGGKSIVFRLPSISLLIYISMTVVSCFPHRFNYPWPVTQSNAESQYRLARTLLSAIKASCLSVFGYIVWARLETAMGARQGLGSWFLLVALSVPAAMLVVYFVRASRAR